MYSAREFSHSTRIDRISGHQDVPPAHAQATLSRRGLTGACAEAAWGRKRATASSYKVPAGRRHRSSRAVLGSLTMQAIQILIFSLLLVATAFAHESVPARSSPSDVFLITIDTLRADHV